MRSTIEELTAARCAARVAAGARAGHLVARLSSITDDGLAALDAGRTAELPDLNTRFHLTMAECSGSASLLALLRQVAERIQWIYAANVSEQGRRSWTEHRGIVEAIARGDGAASAARVREHIDGSRRGFLGP